MLVDGKLVQSGAPYAVQYYRLTAARLAPIQE